MSTTIKIELGERSYDVTVGFGLLDRVGEQARCHAGGERAFLVTDELVRDAYGATVEESLGGAGYSVRTAAVSGGERAKSPDTALTLWKALVASGHERTDPVIALGGGVVGDLAGFVAGTYMRGVPFVHVPTTLLAQVDSSVGGKTAVNLPEGKNLVGVFWQPRAVLADAATLDTLPDRELVAGLAEVVKAALLAGGGFLEFVEDRLEDLVARDHGALQTAISESVRLKARVVQADETDSGMRAILNLGHTVGHALEQQAGYGGVLLHGEAVALGIVAAAHIGEAAGLCPPEVAERQRVLAARLGVALGGAVDIDALVGQMYRDKKTLGGALRLVVLSAPGRPQLVEMHEGTVREGLARFLEEEALRD